MGEFANLQKVYIFATDLPSKKNFMKTLIFSLCHVQFGDKRVCGWTFPANHQA